MSKEWYKCVCDEHKEAKTFFVKSVSYTAHMLMDEDQSIFDFLLKHYACNLRMIHRDDELDLLWDEYTVDGKVPKNIPLISLRPKTMADLEVELKTLRKEAWGALNFILAFYEPGQTHLDTEAWKVAEASARRLRDKLSPLVK